MDNKTRRRLLKGLAVGMPTVWTKPMVDSVVLPTHAGTSGCTLAANCYDTAPGFMQWPGGRGPYNVGFREGSCSGSVNGNLIVVIAASMAEAIELLGQQCGQTVPDTFPSQVSLPGDCEFWYCNVFG